MIQVHSQALNRNIKVDRVIGQLKGRPDQPHLIFFAGIHGNEPSGVIAFQKIFQEIEEKQVPIHASVTAISGNLGALARSERFIDADLNRLWSTNRMDELLKGTLASNYHEDTEQAELLDLIKPILEDNSQELYFFDLHTTSVQTQPFITVNDSILNRKFTKNFPVPLILGIEEYLDGPLLSYINELGYVSFGFEAGQHDSIEAIQNQKAFIYHCLKISGALSSEGWNSLQDFAHFVNHSGHKASFYEITHRYAIKNDEEFKMNPGFVNFDKIKKGQELATSNGKVVKSKAQAIIFMPLYQAKGKDGYFLIQRIPRIYLILSIWLRKLKIDSLFPLLPGIQWMDESKKTMKVDLRIARIIAKPLFHLFGYRSKKKGKHYLEIKNREYGSKHELYTNAPWYS